MIGFVVENGHGPVDLLDEEETYHLVGEGHLAEGDFLIGHTMDLLSKAIRAANNEDKAFGRGSHALLHPLGKVHGTTLTAMLVEQNKVVAGLKLLLQEFGLAFLLLVNAEVLGVLEFGNDLDVERNVMGDAIDILLDERRKAGVGSLADDNKR